MTTSPLIVSDALLASIVIAPFLSMFTLVPEASIVNAPSESTCTLVPDACSLRKSSSGPSVGRVPTTASLPAPTAIFRPLSSMTRLPVGPVRSFTAFVLSKFVQSNFSQASIVVIFVWSAGSAAALTSIGRDNHQSPGWFGGGGKAGWLDQM